MTAEVANQRILGSGPHIRWVDDADRIIVVDDTAHATHELEGMEAIVWRAMALSYSHQRIVALLCHLSDRPRPGAELELARVLAHWRDLGLLERG